jgi:hypothetical protein
MEAMVVVGEHMYTRAKHKTKREQQEEGDGQTIQLDRRLTYTPMPKINSDNMT